MDNIKTNGYYVRKIIGDLQFIREHTRDISPDEFEKHELLVDSVMFRLIQISENCGKLTDDFKSRYPEIPWHAMRGLRNRIVHKYGNVILTVVYDTVINDVPALLELMNRLDK